MGSQRLFGWIHLSDIHIGHGGANHKADQELVLRALAEDVSTQIAEGAPPPDVVLVTGDIAFSGACAMPDEYEKAAQFLGEIARAAGVTTNDVYVVPGNHDVQRPVDKPLQAKTMLKSLRGGDPHLDDALGDDATRAHIASRQSNYFAFVEGMAPGCRADTTARLPRLYWTHTLTARDGLRVRLCGLNTALLAADESVFGVDQGALSLGKRQLVEVLPGRADPTEVVVAMSHHPFSEGWLRDESEAHAWIRNHAHVHLSGHLHRAKNAHVRSGVGSDFVHVAAGAAHGEKEPTGTEARHGYSFGSLVARGRGVELVVRPRRWSDERKHFTRDTEAADEKTGEARHPMARVKLAKTKPAATRSPKAPANRPTSRPPASDSPSEPTASVDEAAILDDLKALLDAQLEEVMVRFAGDHRASLAPSSSPLVLRALDTVRLAKQHPDGLARLASMVTTVRFAAPPPSRPPATSRPPPEVAVAGPRSVHASVAGVEAQVTELLAKHPRVVGELTQEGFGSDAPSVTKALFHERTALSVVVALNRTGDRLDDDLSASDADRVAVHRLFHECVRYASDWQATIENCRRKIHAGPDAIELPTRKGTIAELMLAGVDDAQPAFDLRTPRAVTVLAQVTIPASLRGPIALTQQVFTSEMVKHLAETVFESDPDLAVSRTSPGSPAALADMEGTLRGHRARHRSSKVRPYYVAIEQEDVALWRVACEAQQSGAGLSSLRLVRLAGAIDPDEADILVHVKDILNRRRKPS